MKQVVPGNLNPLWPLIAVIGDADAARQSTKYRVAQQVGRSLVDAGCRILTGGLGGVMEAACRGGHASWRYQPGSTVGVLPGSDPNDANEFVDIILPTALHHVRNSLVAHADAVVAIGGGAGTLSEICFAWMYKRLIIALKVRGWSGRLAGTRLDNRIRYPHLPKDQIYPANNAGDVVRLLRAHLPAYQVRRRLNFPTGPGGKTVARRR
jgi:hypothetical protein